MFLGNTFNFSEYTAGEKGNLAMHYLRMNQEYSLAKKSMAQAASEAAATQSRLDAGNRLLGKIDKTLHAVDQSVQGVAETVDRQGLVMTETMRLGFDLLSNDLRASSDSTTTAIGNLSATLRQSVHELSATFCQSFAHVVAEIGHCSDDLQSLIRLASTPVQVAAYNHYSIARDAFRQGLYAECLEELDRAINGDNASSGYKLDWRFHFLKGTVCLGFLGCDTDLIQLEEAEKAFLLAARYARADYPKDAARAFLQAGWAAYCNDKLPTALETTRLAYQTNCDLDYAYYQAAKISAGLRLLEDMRNELSQASAHTISYLHRAITDRAFSDFRPTIQDLLRTNAEGHVEHVLIIYSGIRQKILELAHTGGDCEQLLRPAADMLPSDQNVRAVLSAYTAKLKPENCEKKHSADDLFRSIQITDVLNALSAELPRVVQALRATAESERCLQNFKCKCDGPFAEARNRYTIEMTPLLSKQRELREEIAHKEALLLQAETRTAKAAATISVLTEKISKIVTLLERQLKEAWDSRQRNIFWRIRRRFSMEDAYNPRRAFALKDQIGMCFRDAVIPSILQPEPEDTTGLGLREFFKAKVTSGPQSAVPFLEVVPDSCNVATVNDHFRNAVRRACIPEQAYATVWSDYIDAVRLFQTAINELEEAQSDCELLKRLSLRKLNADLVQSEQRSTLLRNAISAQVAPLKQEYERLNGVRDQNVTAQNTVMSKVADLCETVRRACRGE